MKKTKPRNYLFYTHKLSFKPDTAHEIHDVLCANAAANLGYPTLFAYPERRHLRRNPIAFLNPVQPRKPSQELIDFYNIDSDLKVAQLPLPWFNDRGDKWTSSSTTVCKYYFPVHMLGQTQIVHTQSWNFVQAAIEHNIPVIYETHYFQKQDFDPNIVQNPLFQVAITQSELTRTSLIDHGMPPEKAVAMHNGFEQAFLNRVPEEAADWRRELLQDGRQELVVYSGALYGFKGIDVLIDAAAALPQVQFVLTGGTAEQVAHYRAIAAPLKNVTFLGWVNPRQKLISLMQAADVLAHPHRSGKEADFTNPVKFFQYIASGTPIVATEIGPLKEFQRPELAMVWCPPDDPKALAEALQKSLYQYPRSVEGYDVNIEFSHQFSWEKRIDRILDLVAPEYRPTR